MTLTILTSDSPCQDYSTDIEREKYLKTRLLIMVSV